MNASALYAERARAAKLVKLATVIDTALRFMGTDPFSASAYEYVEAMTPHAWDEAIKAAQVPGASETTRDALRAVYRARAEARSALAADPFRRLPRNPFRKASGT